MIRGWHDRDELIGRRLLGTDGHVRTITEISKDGSMVCTERLRGHNYRLWIGRTMAEMRVAHYEAEHVIGPERPTKPTRPARSDAELLDDLLAKIRRDQEAS